MTSKYFTPGKTSVKAKISSVNAFTNYKSIGSENIFNNYFPCNCNNVVKSENFLNGYANMSRKQIQANIINNAYGRKTSFGNYNYGGNDYVNYLGKVYGQNGGGGKPIRNQFV